MLFWFINILQTLCIQCVHVSVCSTRLLAIRSLDWSPRYRTTLYKEYAPSVMCLYVHTCLHICVQATVAQFPLHSLSSAHLVITLNHIPLSHIYCFLVWFREELYEHTGLVDEKLVCAWDINEIWCGFMQLPSLCCYIENHLSHALRLTVSVLGST